MIKVIICLVLIYLGALQAVNFTSVTDESNNIEYQIFEVIFGNGTVGLVQVPIENGGSKLNELLRSVEEFVMHNARGFFDKDFMEIEAYAVGHIIHTVNTLLTNANVPYRLNVASYTQSLLLDSQYRLSSRVTNPNPLMLLFDKYYTGD
jgi:hypothetical protein